MASLDPVFNELAATTRNEIRNGVVYNNFWVDTPFQEHMRRYGNVDPFKGGLLMQLPFKYKGPDGGAVNPGQTVTVSKKQTIAAQGFTPKAYATWYAVDDWETANGDHDGVINAGPEAAVDIYMDYLQSLTEQLNTYLEFDVYRHGQANSGSLITDDRHLAINGLSEACNDGITPSWDGNRFVNYGRQPRNGAIQNALNSIPRWAGNPDGSTGQISFEFMSAIYAQTIHRSDLGLASKIGYTYITSLYQRQQRWNQMGVGKDGLKWKGLQFEDAIIYDDWMVPSAVDQSFLPQSLTGSGGITNQTSTFVVPAAASSVSGLPTAGVTVTVGETLWFLYGPSFYCRPVASKAWFFGIRRTQAYDNISLDALFMRLGINVYTTAPRDNVQAYGYSA